MPPPSLRGLLRVLEHADQNLDDFLNIRRWLTGKLHSKLRRRRAIADAKPTLLEVSKVPRSRHPLQIWFTQNDRLRLCRAIIRPLVFLSCVRFPRPRRDQRLKRFYAVV